ncbi:TolC family protein [Rhodoblastus sp.]|uniref:TolC family protein n=1 Tax=Rhodoblastus sp. TaxID=1962975 RepID=UPI0035AF16D3
MPRFAPLSRLVLLAAALAGCAPSSIELAPSAPDRPWTPRVNADGEIQPGPPAPASAAANYVLPSNPAAGRLTDQPEVDTRHVYDLAELIDLAERTNPATRIAWNAARETALATGVAKSAYLPRIVAAVTGIYQASKGTDTVTVGPLSTSGVSASGSADGVISAVTLQWMLFDFGQRDAVVAAAEQATVITNIGFTAVHQQVIFDVSSAFYAYAAARAKHGANEQSLRNAREVLDAAEERMKKGIGTAIEVAEARQGVAQAQLLVVQADGAEKSDYVNLVASVGLTPTTQIGIVDTGRRNLSAAMAKTIDRNVEKALARRPDVLQAFAAEKASQAKLRAAQAEMMPKVFLSGTGNYNAGDLTTSTIFPTGLQTPIANLSGGRYGGAVLVGAAVPLFDGGVREAMIEQARTGVDTAATQLARTRQQAVRQIVVASTTLTTSLAAYDAAKALASASEVTYAAALASYRGGVGDITAVSLAQTRLLQARNAQAEAYSAALSAAALLALATGSLGSAAP